MKHIVVLGGGISGLCSAYFLQKREGVKITLVEKGDHLGGWIRTKEQSGFLFEQGPRSCRPVGDGVELLKLIEEIGLEEQLVVSGQDAKKRYLLRGGSLKKMPNCPFSVLSSGFAFQLFSALLKDWWVSKNDSEDESIHSFVTRRFGKKLAEDFFDPLVSGIYAGNIKKLSVRTCFPILYEWEKKYGSLLKGAFRNRGKREKQDPDFSKVGRGNVFSFKEGMETLVRRLQSKIEGDILLNSEVISLSEGLLVGLKNGKSIKADGVISTLPSFALANVIQGNSSLAKNLRSIPFTSLAVVNLGYRASVLKKTGFGYLVPSNERKKILGVVFDSCVFKEHNRNSKETRLSVMIGGENMGDFGTLEEGDLEMIALEAAREQLGIGVNPDAMQVNWARRSIPQYLVGHWSKVKRIKQEAKAHFPNLWLLGSCYDKVALGSLVVGAKEMAETLEWS